MTTFPQESQLANGKPSSRYLDVIWVGCCLLLSSIWCISSATQLGATFDEPVYLQEGLHSWRTGRIGELMKLGTMPLPVDVQTFPLYVWEQWRQSPIDLETEFHSALPIARAANLVFWSMLLIYGWLVARSLGGPWAGRLAVSVLACEPTLLAHASLATTDISVTACLLAFVYHYRANRGQKKWSWRIAWPALFLAIATLAKVSGLVFAGICMLVADQEWRSSIRRKVQAEGGPESDIPTFKKSYWEMWQIGLLAMVMVFFYIGTDYETEPTFVKWAHSLSEGTFASIMVWLADNLCIFSNAGEGIFKQFTHNVRGHGVFILGETHRRALWYYFPVVLGIKLTLPLLLAPLMVVIMRWRGVKAPQRIFNWALRCSLWLLAFTVICRVQIGVRMVLPLVTLAVVGLSAAIVESIQLLRHEWQTRLSTTIVGLSVGYSFITAMIIWPHGISYINPFWRQVGEDYQLVSEANLDWGQGLKELQQWQQDHPQLPLAMWYYGTDPIEKELTIPSMKLHQLQEVSDAAVRQRVQGKYLAVSTTFVSTPLRYKSVMELSEYFQSLKPVARTSTFLIYDFTQASQITQKHP